MRTKASSDSGHRNPRLSSTRAQRKDRRMDRRDALKKLGLGGATIIGASAVSSSPAFADSGTVNCRYTYSTAATAAITLTRPANNSGRFLVTTTPPAGSCPCGTASPIVSYSFYGALTDNSTATASSGGWIAGSTFDSGTLAIGGGNSSFAYNVQVGVRVQCRDKNGQLTAVCRFRSVSGTNAPTTLAAAGLAATSSANLPTC